MIISLLTLGFLVMPVLALEPGDRAPEEVQVKVKAFAKQLANRMNEKDLVGVQNTVKEIREVLGQYAGLPESPEKRLADSDTRSPDLALVKTVWRKVFAGLEKSEGTRNTLAEKNQLELREVAYLALSCLAAAEVDVENSDTYRSLAREQLEYLLVRQDANGIFPYPVEPRGRSPENVRAMVAKTRKEHPELVRGGYLYLDTPDMQFDVGCCGVALAEGFRVFQDSTYLEAATLAADWAAGKQMSPNWNYNAFSVWLLANVYSITTDDQYLERAIEKATYGVLPGLMENGRWVDQHNAKQSYHFIMVRALSDLLAVLPDGHADKKALEEKLLLATEARAKDIVGDGVTNVASALWGLSQVLYRQGGSGVREGAANAIVNAMIEAGNPGGIGFVLSFYLRARQVRDEAPMDRNGTGNRDPFDAKDWPGRMSEQDRAGMKHEAEQLVARMNADDALGVAEAVRRLREIHGDFSGVPEKSPEYFGPPDPSEPDVERVTELWRDSFERMKGKNAFEVAPAADAEHQTGYRLRVSLRHGRAYLQSAEAGGEGGESYRDYGIQSFDYLVSAQTSSGVFGFPYDPSGGRLKQGAARLVEKGEATGRKMVENGWLIEDLGEGGLQFDNGMVGFGLVYAWALTGNQVYLDAARRAGDWAIDRPMVANWNYNSFSGLLLARLYRATGEQKYLDAAHQKIELGVIPGQMENGRWFDQHNAKIQYHSVMLRSLVEYYLALTQAGEADGASAIRGRVVLGLDNLSSQILTHGASNIHELLSLDALILGSAALGEKATWRQAANVNVNALCDRALPELEKRDYPMTETVAGWLLYRRARERNVNLVEISEGMKGRQDP